MSHLNDVGIWKSNILLYMLYTSKKDMELTPSSSVFWQTSSINAFSTFLSFYTNAYQSSSSLLFNPWLQKFIFYVAYKL